MKSMGVAVIAAIGLVAFAGGETIQSRPQVARARRTAEPMRESPNLLWVYKSTLPVSPRGYQVYMSGLFVEPPSLVVEYGNRERVAAIDIETGRELWHFDSVPINGDPRWQEFTNPKLTGIARQGTKIAAVVGTPPLHWVGNKLPDWSIQALDMKTGRVLWRDKADQEPLCVVGDQIVYLTKGSNQARFRDAFTGAWLSRPKTTTANLSLAPYSVLENGRVLVNNRSLPAILDLKTGRVSNLPLPNRPNYDPADKSEPVPVGFLYENGSSTALFAASRRVFSILDTDNGRVGGSMDPKFLFCCSPEGKPFWQFPRKSVHNEYHEPTGLRFIDRAIPLIKVGLVMAVSGFSANSALHGIRISDGRELWKRRVPAGSWALFPFGTSAVAIGAPEQNRRSYSLLYQVDGATGRIKLSKRLPYAYRFAVSGDRLLLLGLDRLYAYRLSSLLARTSR